MIIVWYIFASIIIIAGIVCIPLDIWRKRVVTKQLKDQTEKLNKSTKELQANLKKLKQIAKGKDK
jgi:hypothetical protein